MMTDKKDVEGAGGPSESAPQGSHPARSLEPRAKGYGIGGGHEKPYHQRQGAKRDQSNCYGPVPHSGYYGAGAGTERFERGNAGFNAELSWYRAQYGQNTSGNSKYQS